MEHPKYSIHLTHLQGIPALDEFDSVGLYVYSDKMYIVQADKKIVIKIFFKDVINTGVLKKTENYEKDKSVIGRALVGGIVAGPVGAIVGGMSGIGKKPAKKEYFCFTIAYTDEDGNCNSGMFSLGNKYLADQLNKISKYINDSMELYKTNT